MCFWQGDEEYCHCVTIPGVSDILFLGDILLELQEMFIIFL